MQIYWWKDNQRIVASLYGTRQVTQIDWYLRDSIPVDIYIVQSQTSINQPFAVTSVGDGNSIRFGAKSDYDNIDFLFSQATWIASGSGDSQKYSAQISLNTTELIAAMAAVDTLTVKAEFTIVQSDNSHALTTQFDIQITRDVIVGTEGVPTTKFNVIEQFTDTDGIAKVRLVNASGETCFVAAPL